MSTGFLNCLDHVFSSVIPCFLADTICVHQQSRERVEPHPHSPGGSREQNAASRRGEGTVGQDCTGRATLGLSCMCYSKICFLHPEQSESRRGYKGRKASLSSSTVTGEDHVVLLHMGQFMGAKMTPRQFLMKRRLNVIVTLVTVY